MEDVKKEEPVKAAGLMAKREYRSLKLQLEEMQTGYKKIYIICGIMCFIVFYGVGIVSLSRTSIYNTMEISLISFIFSFLETLFFIMYLHLKRSEKERMLRREILEYEIEDIQKEVQEDIFENSIKMSYKYLDQYYQQTREQAHKGLYVTVCISVAGGILLGVGIIAMFLEKAEPAVVACASGVVTEFAAAVFFYLYNRTITSMSKYHKKLVLSHNISIALKVAETLPEDDKTKNKNMIISELLKDINTYLMKGE